MTLWRQTISLQNSVGLSNQKESKIIPVGQKGRLLRRRKEMSGAQAGFVYAEEGRTERQDIPFPWHCFSLYLWLTSLVWALEWSSQKLHIQHRLARSQLSDFNCSILIRPQKQQAGDRERKWRGLHPLLSHHHCQEAAEHKTSSLRWDQLLKHYQCQHLLCHLTQATVRFKTTKPDKHPHIPLSLLGSCDSSNTKVFTRQPDPALSASPQ